MLRYISLVSLIFLIVVSCSNVAGKSNSHDIPIMSPFSDSTLNRISDIGFYDLISHFQSTTLPFYFGFDSPHDQKFDSITFHDNKYVYEHFRLPMDTVVKYFFQGNKELNKQPSGGIYEHFYGYRLPSNGDYVLVFYYRRPSVDEYSYRLASFDYSGILIDDIGLVGGLGEFDPETQRECILNTDWSINIEELSSIDYSDSKEIPETGEYQYKVKRTDFVYQITNEGHFKMIKNENLGSFYYTEKDIEGRGYQLIAPDGVTSLFKSHSE